jgi:PAS domain S-box-containing protein
MFLNAVQREREWPDAFVTRLRVLGEMLVGALERQEMFAGLREAEERVSLAAASAEAGLWVLDDHTGTFWVSERGRAIFGFAADEVVDMKRLAASVHPDDWATVERAVSRSTRFGEPIDLEFRIVTGRGLRWVASRGRPQAMANGAGMRLTGVTMDISERRRAEDALHISEARLASAADLAGLAFYEVRVDEGVAYVDHRFRDICGLGDDVVEGLAPLEFWAAHLHPDDRHRVESTRQMLHARSPDQASFEYRYLHPTCGERWMHHLARVARRDADGRAITTFGVLRDITAHKRAEAELRDLSQRLIRAHEDQRALLARELHDDLTQRLAVLAIDVGRAELLAGGGAQAETLRGVRDGLVQLSEDVHSLAYQLHSSVLDDLGLAEALRAECERVGRLAPVELSVELEPVSAGVAGDVALCLFRVAQEALTNVIRHAGARAVSVVLRHMDDGLLLAVRDDGAGFDPESPRRVRSLGLASMRERVQLVNGTLDIESAPGRGTTIVVWAPGTGGAP